MLWFCRISRRHRAGVSAIGFTTGTVVVASRVGGLADLLQDQTTALLVEPRDAISLAETLITILKDGEKQAYIRDQARVLGEGELSWPVIAGATLATYKRALAKN